MIVFICCISGANSDEIVIALDADFTGGAKKGGLAIRRGAELAIDEINASGGILGKKLTLSVSDHRGNPARGLANLKNAIASKQLIAVLGGVHTPVVLGQLPLVHKSGIPFLIPWAAGTSIVDNSLENNNVFRVSLRDSEAAITILDYAKSKGYDKLSLVLERTGWGRSNEKSMMSYAQKIGLEIDQVTWFNWRQKSFENLINNIGFAHKKALVFVGNAPEGADFMKQLMLSKPKSSLPVLSHWGITAGDFKGMLGAKTLEKVNLSVLQSFHFDKTAMKSNAAKLINHYNVKYQENINASSIPAAAGVAQTYDLVMLLKQAIENKQSTLHKDIIIGLEQIDRHQGLVRTYIQPFSETKRDTLFAKDYLMTRYDKSGFLVPVNDE